MFSQPLKDLDNLVGRFSLRKNHFRETRAQCPVMIDLNETIRKALSLLQHEFLEKPIHQVVDLEEDMPLVTASPDHLQGVWTNLIMNALDATNHAEGEIRIVSRFQNNEFKVTVTDNGKGIPVDKISRIFEPFYTTKEAGRGTGLGLSVCHRIVKNHGGYIHVESQVGLGTKFTVIFPVRP